MLLKTFRRLCRNRSGQDNKSIRKNKKKVVDNLRSVRERIFYIKSRLELQRGKHGVSIETMRRQILKIRRVLNQGTSILLGNNYCQIKMRLM